YDLAKYDCLYAGKVAKDIRFESADAADPAKFYLFSTPAHQAHPTVLLTSDPQWRYGPCRRCGFARRQVTGLFTGEQ
ncbi:hypothetical protein ACCT31_39305, partial [Rhizobium ruizarguesonis]